MNGGADLLSAFYLVCFIVGFALTLLSFLLGAHHFGDVNAHVDVGHAGDLNVGHAHADLGHAGDVSLEGGDASSGGLASVAHVSPFNFSSIMAFITWFGGAGYILRVYSGLAAILGLLLALLAGLFGGSVVFYYLARILIPGQTHMDPTDYYMPGTIARVTSTIQGDGTGEIVYSQGGYRKTAGARSATGETVPRETEVVIVSYDKGLAYVQSWDSYMKNGPAEMPDPGASGTAEASGSTAATRERTGT